MYHQMGIEWVADICVLWGGESEVEAASLLLGCKSSRQSYRWAGSQLLCQYARLLTSQTEIQDPFEKELVGLSGVLEENGLRKEMKAPSANVKGDQTGREGPVPVGRVGR